MFIINCLFTRIYCMLFLLSSFWKCTENVYIIKIVLKLGLSLEDDYWVECTAEKNWCRETSLWSGYGFRFPARRRFQETYLWYIPTEIIIQLHSRAFGRWIATFTSIKRTTHFSESRSRADTFLPKGTNFGFITVRAWWNIGTTLFVEQELKSKGGLSHFSCHLVP